MSGARKRADEGEPLARRVFAAIAGGGFRSGEQLAAELGVSRSAVWKAIENLRAMAAEIHAVPNRGYRLARPTTPLDGRRIAARLSPRGADAVCELDTVWSIDSTNARLFEGSQPAPGYARVLLAEHQSAGRGRRGRAWLAPLGGSICLSIGWSFRQLPPDVGALSLAIGVCARRALRDAGIEGLALKWPNDLLAGDAKVGGILIELRAEATGPAFAVIGIGLNVALGVRLRAAVADTGTRATDLLSLGLADADRNRLAAQVIDRCVEGLREFETSGLRPFAAEWREADALRGRQVTVRCGSESLAGVARGIDVSGALMLETSAGLRNLIAGEVTVRAEQ